MKVYIDNGESVLVGNIEDVRVYKAGMITIVTDNFEVSLLPDSFDDVERLIALKLILCRA